MNRMLVGSSRETDDELRHRVEGLIANNRTMVVCGRCGGLVVGRRAGLILMMPAVKQQCVKCGWSVTGFTHKACVNGWTDYESAVGIQ